MYTQDVVFNYKQVCNKGGAARRRFYISVNNRWEADPPPPLSGARDNVTSSQDTTKRE